MLAPEQSHERCVTPGGRGWCDMLGPPVPLAGPAFSGLAGVVRRQASKQSRTHDFSREKVPNP
jgi:hypothetical protein